METYWADLRPRRPPVEKTPPSHREPPPTITSGLLPPRWYAPRTIRNHPPEHVDEICLWCDTPSMSCGTANMPHVHNGIDGEADNCQVRKCRSALVCSWLLPLRRPRREVISSGSTPNFLERVYTGPGSSPGAVRRRDSREAIAGRGSSCRQGSATVGRVL